jgi:single-stranded-DNA-specific exonuclease
MAGGLSLTPDQLVPFSEWLNARVGLQKQTLVAARELCIDAVIGPGAGTVELCDMVDRLGPFGAGAPQPIFAMQDIAVTGGRQIGQNHFKFIAEDTSGRVECIAWRALDTPLGDAIRQGGRLHIAGRLKVNEWQGRRRVQMDIMDAAAVS